MMGADFLLKALGIPDDQLAALKAMLNPENVRGLIENFSRRFNEMEARNIATHALITELAARNNVQTLAVELPRAGIAQYAPQGGDIIPPLLTAEMDRQAVIFEERTHDHGNDRNDCDHNGHDASDGNSSASSSGGGGFSFSN